MISREEATLLAKRYIAHRLDRPELGLELRPELTTEYSFGWVFFYNTREFIRTGDLRYAAGGNARFSWNGKRVDFS